HPGGLRVRARQQDHEFLAAIARGDVAAADRAADASRDLLQDFVTGEMPMPVVDALEVVDVDHEARERTALPPAAHDLLAKAGLKVAAVVPAGQNVREP